MKSSRPYLVRALYQWIVDNDCTPHLLVDARLPGVEVPQQYVNNGQIVLNIVPSAVAGLELGDDWIAFSGRFGGVASNVLVPVGAVLGIYARENGQGMVFEAEQSPPPEPADENPAAARAAKPSLRVVK